MVAPQELALTRRTPASLSVITALFHLLVAHQELALARRTPALPSPFQGGMGVDRSASGEILCRFPAIYLTQQVAQYVSHVVPFIPHCTQ